MELLYEIFGGHINDLGYKVLDSHIGAIYGDSITLERAQRISEKLEAKGFATTNVVYGIGSYSYQYATRDTFGWAIKATYAKVNGEERLLFKDPKTDSGVKKSQRGRVLVNEVDGELTFTDGYLDDDTYQRALAESALKPVFIDGQLLRETTLADIRQKLGTL